MRRLESSGRKGRVFLVGAGPGDPELLTLRALKILQSADAVLHDDLVPPEILALIRTRQIESVGKRCGAKCVSQEAIHARMIELARAGLTVARLKSGDPLIFGRAGEEMDALREAGVAFEVIPGVTAASGAAASARIPLTDRRCASQVMFVSAHHAAGGAAIAGFAQDNARTTLVIHMPGDDYARLRRELLASGRNAETPCVIVSNAGRAEERISSTTLANLTQAPALPSPKILIVGDVAAGAIRANETGITDADPLFADGRPEESLALASVSRLD